MPRRNRTPKQPPKTPRSTHEAGKVRYASKSAAEAAIQRSKQYSPYLQLRTYQSLTDGGWYLTSR